jgi:RNA polymerase-interacting CarD/CdnL/TRCF family regulator
MPATSSRHPHRYSIAGRRPVGRAAGRPDEVSDLAVGDPVVSPRHGVGTVVERSVRQLGGTEREFVEVEIERRGLRLLVPVDADGSGCIPLRPIASPVAAGEAMAALAGEPRSMSADWRVRQREGAQRLAGGDLLSAAELVRDLAHCGRIRRPAVTDRELYDSTRERVEEELQAVFEIGPREARRRVAQRLEASGAGTDAGR